MKINTIKNSINMPERSFFHLRGIAAVIMALSVSVGCTKASNQPDIFVDEVYKIYVSEDSNSSSIQESEKIYSNALSALIKKEVTSTPVGEVGKLDFEPLCACQDTGGIKGIKSEKPKPNGNGYTSNVILQTDSDQKIIVLDLVNEAGLWKIDEVRTTEVQSLKSYLSRP